MLLAQHGSSRSGGKGTYASEPIELTNETGQGVAVSQGRKRKAEELEDASGRSQGISVLEAKERRMRVKMTGPIPPEQVLVPVRQWDGPPKKPASAQPWNGPPPKGALVEDKGDEQQLNYGLQPRVSAMEAEDKAIFVIYRTKPVGYALRPAMYKQYGSVWVTTEVMDWADKLMQRGKGPQDFEDQVAKCSAFRGRYYASRNDILDEAGKTAAFEKIYDELGELLQMVGAARPAKVTGYPVLKSLRQDGNWRCAKGQPLRAYRPLQQRQPGPPRPAIPQQQQSGPPRPSVSQQQQLNPSRPSAAGERFQLGPMRPTIAQQIPVPPPPQRTIIPGLSGDDLSPSISNPLPLEALILERDPPRAPTSVAQSVSLPVQSGPVLASGPSSPAMSNPIFPTRTVGVSGPVTPPMLSQGVGLGPTPDSIAPIVAASRPPPLQAGLVLPPAGERSKEYMNALDFKAFVKTINGRYNSASNRYLNRDQLRAPSSSYLLACDARIQARQDFEECRRLLRMRFDEQNCPVPILGRDKLLERLGVLELLRRPHFLATVLGVEKLFLWDAGPWDSANFINEVCGLLEWYGYR